MQKFSLLFFLACFFPASPILAEEKPAVECRKEDQTKTIDPHLQKLSESLEKITGHIGPDKIGLENGCVSMSFDDGYRAVFNDALPLFKKYGMVGTAYITTGVTNQDGYMTWDHIRELEQQGWEIGAHSDTHPEFEKIPLKEVKKEAFTSLDKLKKHGLKACGFAFPYGSYTQEDLALLSKKFCERRGFWDRDELNDPTSMNADLVQVKGVVKETTLDEIKSWLDQAKKEKRCLALVFHDLSEKGHYTGSPHHIRDEKGDVPADYEFTYNLPTLEAALQAVKDSGLPVVTESQMIKMP
ncbi:MAG: polysaccharide deacetylase family protein [Bacteriovorax sp.]